MRPELWRNIYCVYAAPPGGGRGKGRGGWNQPPVARAAPFPSHQCSFFPATQLAPLSRWQKKIKRRKKEHNPIQAVGKEKWEGKCALDAHVWICAATASAAWQSHKSFTFLGERERERERAVARVCFEKDETAFAQYTSADAPRARRRQQSDLLTDSAPKTKGPWIKHVLICILKKGKSWQ